jgi:tetratricopeptide (TPR) repeat protein
MRDHPFLKAGFVLSILAIVFASGCAPGPRPAAGEPSEKDFQVYFNRGVDLFNRGEYFGAASALSRALAVNPGSAVALNLLGICHFQRKDYAAARIHFEKAAAADPSYAQAFNNLASVYFVQGDYDQAEASFKKALEIKPDLISTLYSLGNLLLSRDRNEEGTACLAKAIALDPNYLETHQSLITETAQEGFKPSEAFFLYARLFAQAGNAAKTVLYLAKAERAGFGDWRKVLTDTAFNRVRDMPAFQDFLQARLKF